MAKRLGKFVKEGVLKMTDEEISELGSSTMCVLYGYNNYNASVAHIMELKAEVLKDYPETKDENMEVWFIGNGESIRHARMTMLCVRIPVEDFFKLRANNEISTL